MSRRNGAAFAQEIAARLNLASLPPPLQQRLVPLVRQYEAQQRALDETADALLREMALIRQELEQMAEKREERDA